MCTLKTYLLDYWLDSNKSLELLPAIFPSGTSYQKLSDIYDYDKIELNNKLVKIKVMSK